MERRLCGVVGLAGRRVEKFEQRARRLEIVRQLDVQARQPLGRLIGEEEGRDESNESAGRRAGTADTIGRVHEHGRDGKAAEHLHQRSRAIAHARHLIGSNLDLIDPEIHLAPNLVLEPEGLDHAHPLQRLLQHQKDARAACILDVRQCPDALGEVAQHKHCSRHQQDADDGQERILVDHDSHETDQQEHVAPGSGDEQVEDRRNTHAAIGDLRHVRR